MTTEELWDDIQTLVFIPNEIRKDVFGTANTGAIFRTTELEDFNAKIQECQSKIITPGDYVRRKDNPTTVGLCIESEVERGSITILSTGPCVFSAYVGQYVKTGVHTDLLDRLLEQIKFEKGA